MTVCGTVVLECGEFDSEYSYKLACFLGATGGEQALFDPAMSGILQSILVSRARSHQCKRETRRLKSSQVPRRLAEDCQTLDESRESQELPFSCCREFGSSDP